ncbi:MAG TPA: energy transducer TonB [Rhodothermales bacterium]|nr:energy transducer TonB [Rhodothermales bacterium]
MFGPRFGSARTPLVHAGAVATPYGAAELRALTPYHTARGLLTAALLHVAAFGAVEALREPPAPLLSPQGQLTGTVLSPPILTPPARSATPAAVRLARPGGMPTPVPDAQVRQATRSEAPSSISAPGGEDETGSSRSDVIGIEDIERVTPGLVTVPATVDTVVRPPVLPAVTEALEITAIMPRVLESTAPEYPALARHAGVEGRVILRVRVGRDGRAREITVVRSDNSMLDAAAATAVARWRFAPGEQAGQPVDVWMTIPIRFRLRERS